MALGSDWAPSRTKNLLGELKVAWLVSQERELPNGDPLFSPAELVAMVTVNPATIVGWQTRLGLVAKDRWADLVVVKGTTGDGHRHLIEALEADISLVMIDGIPRASTATLMNRFVGPTETATIAGKSRRLNLVDPHRARWSPR